MKVNGKKILIYIALAFVLLNLCWFLITNIKYNKFVKAVPKDEYGLYLLLKEDGYSYYVKKPGYLHYTGNLIVKDTNKKISLFIWPLISGGYEYGFRFEENGWFTDINIDKNLEAEAQGKTFDVQKVKEYKTDLEELYSKANEMWQLEE